MAAGERVHGAGHFVWERGSERLETGNSVTAEISDDGVRCEIGGASGKTATVEVTSREGIRLMRKIAHAMQETGCRPRPFGGSFWKSTPKRKSTTLQPAVECPNCAGNVAPDCELCDGEGWVAVDRIEAWRRG